MYYEVQDVRLEAGQIKLGVRLQKKIVRPDKYKYARKMPWTIENEKS